MPAISSPALEGTQDTLPGTLRRPGGGASRCSGVRACSGLKHTLQWVMPRARSSLRITRARGQTEVLAMSEMVRRVGSSLLPVPRAERMGI